MMRLQKSPVPDGSASFLPPFLGPPYCDTVLSSFRFRADPPSIQVQRGATLDLGCVCSNLRPEKEVVRTLAQPVSNENDCLATESQEGSFVESARRLGITFEFQSNATGAWTIRKACPVDQLLCLRKSVLCKGNPSLHGGVLSVLGQTHNQKNPLCWTDCLLKFLTDQKGLGATLEAFPLFRGTVGLLFSLNLLKAGWFLDASFKES